MFKMSFEILSSFKVFNFYFNYYLGIALGLSNAFTYRFLLFISIILHLFVKSIVLIIAFLKYGIHKQQINLFLSVFYPR